MEILAEKVIYTMNVWCLMAIVLFILVAIDIIIHCICDESPSNIGLAGMVIGACLGFLFIVFGAEYSIDHPVMEYKVRFTEKIDMEEFLNTYEIRNRDGSIVTIRCLEPCAPSEEITK